MSLALYRGGTRLLAPLAPSLLALRARRGKEEPTRLPERLGVASRTRPAGPLVWLHGASIGETLALLPLVADFQARGLVTLVTSGTRGSAQILAGRLQAGTVHQFAPLDLPRAVDAFLDHWRPNLLLLAESEIWPNMLMGCAARKIPVALVNARLSDRSLARWHRAPAAARALFGIPAVCAVQSEEHAARLSALGARGVIVAGNLKHDVAAPPADPGELARLRGMIGPRPVVVAASSHADEEALLVRAFGALHARRPDLLAVIAPRDVSRGASLLDRAEKAGLAAIARTGELPIGDDTNVLVADTFGEMGLWLRLAAVAIIGKTFAVGGQTPIEAARCNAAIVHGPATENFAEIFAALDAAGGACAVDAATLPDAVAALLDDPERRSAMTQAATRTIDDLAGATAHTLAALAPLMPAAPAMAIPP